MSEKRTIDDVSQSLLERQSHRDPLFARQISEGMHACYANAEALLDDARLLAAGGRLARALSLAVIALEELAKVPMICGTVNLDRSGQAWRAFWTNIRRHTEKQEEMGDYGSLLAAAGPSPYAITFSENVVTAFDAFKQSGLYVDCFDGEFRVPDLYAGGLDVRHSSGQEVWNTNVPDVVVAAVQERVDSFAQFHSTVESSRWFLSDIIKTKRRLEKASERGRRAILRERPGPASRPLSKSVRELEGRVRSAAARFSTELVADYPEFYAWCEAVLPGHPRNMVADALRAEARYLWRRSECKTLPVAAHRSLRMFKLIADFVTSGTSAMSGVVRLEEIVPGGA